MLLSDFAFALRVALGLSVLVAYAGPAGAQEHTDVGEGPRFLLASVTPGRAPTPADASSIPLLRRRVTVEVADTPLPQALAAIGRAAGVRFAYSPEVMAADRKVRIRAEELTLAAVLTEVLLDAKVDVLLLGGSRITLVPREAEPRILVGSVSGRVTNAESGEPVPGAEVFLEGTRWRALTSDDGQYRLAGVEVGTYTIVARRIGYGRASREVTVAVDREATADFALKPAPTRLEELVTTGTVIPTAVKALPTPVTVITEEDIALQRPRTVQELFRQVVPGAISPDNTARPSDTPFSVRGASTLAPGNSQMKVFVDGIEHAFPGNSGVDPNSIERIEVIRGPQAAAIYGSDAIGGVIQIFTKRGNPNLARPRIDAQAALGIVQIPYAGSGGVLRQQYTATVSGGAPDVTYHVGGGYSHTGDYLPNGEQSAQSNPSVYGGMRFSRDIITVDLSSRYAVHNSPEVVNPEFAQTGDLFYSKPLYNPTQWSNQAVGIRLGLALAPWWRHELRMGIDRFTLESAQSQPRLTTPDDTLLNVFNVANTKRSVGYNTSVQVPLGSGISGSLTAGVDHYRLPISVLGAFGTPATTGALGGFVLGVRLSAINTGYFAQGQLGIQDALFLTGGLRAERNSEYGDSLGTPISPRIGVSYVRPVGSTTLKLRGAWGRAIRAPDPSNKASVGPTTLPNFRIGPERQQGWDAGVDATFGARSSLSVTYYDQVAENLIQFVRVQDDPMPLDQFQNVGRVSNNGLELEGSLSFGLVQLKANYAYTRTRIRALSPNYTGDLRVGDQVRSVPRHTAGALLSAAPRSGTTVTAGLTYVGQFTETDQLASLRCGGGTGPCPPSFVVEFPGFIKANASLWQQITPQLSGFVSVYNLTNNDVTESSNVLPVMGRISTAGFRLQY